jgi:hypothetical protein
VAEAENSLVLGPEGVLLPRWEHDVYYATFILVDSVGPPSVEFCRTTTNYPQVDDLRFINPWEA